jgi:hypothetical protein
MCGHTSMPLAQHTRTPIHADPLAASCTFGQAQSGHGYGAAVNAGPSPSLMIECYVILASPAHSHNAKQRSPFGQWAGPRVVATAWAAYREACRAGIGLRFDPPGIPTGG